MKQANVDQMIAEAFIENAKTCKFLFNTVFRNFNCAIKKFQGERAPIESSRVAVSIWGISRLGSAFIFSMIQTYTIMFE